MTISSYWKNWSVDSGMQPSGWLHWLAPNLLIACLYFLAGRLGILLAIPPGVATTLWFPSGLALLGLLFFGYRVWPGVWIGSFLVNILTLWNGVSWDVALHSILACACIATGSSLQAVLGSYLLKKYAPSFQKWDEVSEFFRFVGIAAFTCMVASTTGSLTLSLSGFAPWPLFWESWVTWWLGDLVGILLVLPLPLLFKKEGKRKWGLRDWIEFLLFLSLLLVTSLVVFEDEFHLGSRKFPLDFLIFPFLVWGGFRFHRQGVLWTIWVIVPVAILGTVSGHGPFSPFPQNEALLLLQTFFGILICTGLVFSISLSEQGRAEDELKRAVIDTKKISEMKTEFATIVSHELRTPLTVIKDTISMVLEGVDGPVTEGQRENLEMAMENVDRLVRLINNVLDFEKLESGKMELVLGVSDLKRLLEDIVKFMQVSAKKRDVTILLQVPEQALSVFCDEDKIKEVVLNLVDNSLKYSPAGGRIWIHVEDAGDSVRLDVEDEGAGIPKEEHDKIFEIFRRASTRGAVRIGGSGVGLAVCKSIVDLHGGEIAVESKPGLGTKFIVEIPRHGTKKRKGKL